MDVEPKMTVEEFYDEFSRKLLEDYIHGNRRIPAQKAFFTQSIPPNAENVLFIGSGSGEVPFHIARKMIPWGRIIAADISEKNILIARSLFAQPRIRYEKRDILTEPPDGIFDVVILPDVYEHIPSGSRKDFHKIISDALTDEAMVLLTFPSPEHQRFLEREGRGLQVVDEVVTLDDIQLMAKEIGGVLFFYAVRSIYNRGDYIHAAILKGVKPMAELPPYENMPVELPQATVFDKITRMRGVRKALAMYRRWKVRRLVRE